MVAIQMDVGEAGETRGDARMGRAATRKLGRKVAEAGAVMGLEDVSEHQNWAVPRFEVIQQAQEQGPVMAKAVQGSAVARVQVC